MQKHSSVGTPFSFGRSWRDSLREASLAWALERKRHKRIRHFLFAGLMVLVALANQLGLRNYLGVPYPYVSFYPAIAIAAVMFGRWPGLLAVLLSSLSEAYWFLPPLGDLRVSKTSDQISLLFFVSTGFFMTLLADRSRRYQQRLAERERELALRESRDLLRLFIRHSLPSLAMFDCEMRYLEASQRWLDEYGLSKTEIFGRSHYEVFPEISEEWKAIHARGLAGETISCNEDHFDRPDGTTHWLRWEVRPWRKADGTIGGIVIFAENISELKLAERAMQLSELRYRTAFQTSLDAIGITRLSDGKYVDVNQAFLDMMGYERREVLGYSSLDLGLWADRENRAELIEILHQRTLHKDLQAQFKRKNGEIFWVMMSASLMDLDEEQCLLTVMRDITVSRKAEEEIRRLAFYDPLTGLANRRMLMEQLRRSVASSSRTHLKRGLLFVDLDDFKTLNDTLGHHIGDLMLKEVAERLTLCVREADTVGRLGGDEFVVLLEELSADTEESASQAEKVAEKVLAAIGQPYVLDAFACSTTCSIGITVFGDQHENVNELLQQADIAMYQAKNGGRDLIRQFSPNLQASVNSRAEREKELRQGIDDNQFVLYYQPQIKRGRVIGCEALLRWNHPRLGVLSADEFIPLAEETRLILPLGEWVLETACRQIAAWAANPQTAGIKMAVNISALQLRKPDFVASILDTLARTGADPKSLALELTESMMIDNVEDVIEKMTQLKQRGVRFSVDDFGKGYSSLAYLRRLPLDELKIDRSFIRDIHVDQSGSNIAQTIITLGQAMGLSVIAEGVEMESQRDTLTQLGCHAYQGYFFVRPLPVDEFERMLHGFADGAVLRKRSDQGANGHS
jgi:diguanylate cyclase (GGDEF)-like protein/PAS domain S-box-containing protein